MKLLILSISIGNGHLSVAKSVRLYAEKHYPGITVKEVDYLKYVSIFLDKIVSGSYVHMLNMLPMLYGKLYNNAKNKKLKNGVELLNKIGLSKMEELIGDFKPDVVVCTHPFPLETLSMFKERELLDLPIMAIITDYTIHPKWIYDNVDAYVIPNEDFISDLVGMGIPKEKVYPFGIPISESFFNIKESDKESLIIELDLDKDIPTILIMNGGFGLTDISETFEELMSIDKNFQIIVCAGKNEEMVLSLKEIYSDMHTDKKAVIMGYTDKVNLLMSISDVLVTKPGGLTVTEAMHMKLPIIIKLPIPGQENENTEYLLNCGIALNSDYINIRQVLERLLFSGTTKRIEYIKQMEAEKSKADSSQNICKVLYELTSK